MRSRATPEYANAVEGAYSPLFSFTNFPPSRDVHFNTLYTLRRDKTLPVWLQGGADQLLQRHAKKATMPVFDVTA